MALKLFAGFLASVLLSCGAGEETVYVDSAFSDARKAQIEAARDTWNERAQRKIVFTNERDAEWILLSADTPENAFSGYYHTRRSIVRIDPQTPDAQVYAVALHELGHVLGLRHTATGVMSGTEQSVEFTYDVVLECERVRACQAP